MITSLNHITLAVRDINRSFKFYHDGMGFTPLVKWDKGAYFLVGSEGGTWFCLNVAPNCAPSPDYTHYAFSVNAHDFEAFKERLLSFGAKEFKENTSPGASFYFLDPDGHKLELHTGSWQERLQAKRANPGSWQEVEWFVK